MSEAKIEIKIGQIQFLGQGEQEWVSKQLDKILSQADKLIQLAPSIENGEGEERPHKPMGKDPAIAQKTLPVYLSEKSANKNQTKKFLATSIWLEAKGNGRLKPSDITKALKDANQSRLSNPSDCLAKNVNKGHCERDGAQFFVTDEGKKSL